MLVRNQLSCDECLDCFVKRTKDCITCINTLPDMPILGSSNSAANKDMISTIWTNGDTIIWLSRIHCGKKEILLVMSNFSFSHNVFKSCVLLMCQNEYLWSKGLTLSQTSPGFYVSAVQLNLLKTLWEKEKLLVTSNFSFSHGVFYLFGELSASFIKLVIVICKLVQFGSLKFDVLERVKRPLKGSNDGGLLQQVVSKCRFY